MSSSHKEKYRIYNYSPIYIILLIFVFTSCGDWSSFDLPEQEIENERQLLINVLDINENPLTGYTLDIKGPVSHQQSGVMKSTFSLDNLQDGNYTITVKKDGYVDAEADVTVELPGIEGINHFDEIGLVLQQRADTHLIDYREGGIIRTAPSGENEIFGEPITLSFSPYALPSSLADESGNVQISANRTIPTVIDEEYEGTVQSYITFDTVVGELNEPVTIDIPMQIASQHSEGLTYTLQPGNIPLEEVESGMSGSNEMQKEGPRGRKLRAIIQGIRNYAVVAKLQVRQKVSWSDFEVIEEGGCEEDVTVSYTLQSGDAGQLARDHSHLASKLSGQTYTLDKTFKGVSFKRVTVVVRHRIMEFTVRELFSKVVQEESYVHVKPIQFRRILRECHNSGGS